MRDHAVSLHLTKAESAIASSSFRGLSGQDLSGAPTSGVDLVSNHMLQTLIVGGIQEYHHFHALSSETIVHDLVTIALVTQTVQLIRNVLNGLALEGSRITFISV